MMDTSDVGPYCNWSFIHVHDELWLGPFPAGLPGYEKRLGFFQQGSAYQNNIHWTRHTQWGEAGYCPC